MMAYPDILPGLDVQPGQPFPMGATPTERGVNFVLFSAHAEAVWLCLFSEDGTVEHARLPLTARDGDLWHIHVAGLRPGAVYGWRVAGPYAPADGHRFNPAKLLLDPYARALASGLSWDSAVYGHLLGAEADDTAINVADSAAFVPKAVVAPPSGFDWQGDQPPRHPRQKLLIYEAHVKGLTMRLPGVPEALRGTYEALGSDAVIQHLQALGVTTLQLLPIHAFLDDHRLVDLGLRNYWGYQSIGFFAPEPRYFGPNGADGLRAAIRALHKAGIEVVLDVVFNHSGEGDETGPTLSFRGLDNASYYRLAPDPRHYVNDAGTGNCLNLAHPACQRLVMDSLRYWIESFHVDGFRFDLATALGREASGFDPGAGLLDAMRQDPVIGQARLIAEPWDIGPGGYQLGQFPHPFAEYNDRARDCLRRFWRGDSGQIADLAHRLTGSAAEFDHDARPSSASINFITCHDGFTLADLVAFNTKRNLANGEEGRDGTDANWSAAIGTEGASDDPEITAARLRRMRALLATIFLAQGTPMILAGDEAANSQGGNNNVYAQDNETGWVEWSGLEQAGLAPFIGRLSAMRKTLRALHQFAFLHGRALPDGRPDLIWFRPDGARPVAADWQSPDWRCLCMLHNMAEGRDLFLIFNAGADEEVHLPEGDWHLVLESATGTSEGEVHSGAILMPTQSVRLYATYPLDAADIPT